MSQPDDHRAERTALWKGIAIGTLIMGAPPAAAMHWHAAKEIARFIFHLATTT